MVISFFNVVGHHIFKWQHSFYVQIPCTGNQIFLICIFCCQLVSNQVAAVVGKFAIHIIVFLRMPSRRFYLTDRTSFFGRHEILSYIGVCDTTSA